MSHTSHYLISIVVPIHNEESGLLKFHKSLINVLEQVVENDYEIIYCDDGSTDNTAKLVSEWNHNDPNIKLISFSRNFGKENALTAGIAASNSKAIITIDGDGQHPVELIPKFIETWRTGTQVVIGLRTGNSGASWMKNTGSQLFHKIFNIITGQKLIMGTTDFRLIDASVQEAFLNLKETDRITRGLIDWLGFKRSYIKFNAKHRESGSPSYGFNKLIGLAVNSVASLTPKPLYMFGYLGVFITLMSLLLGISVFIEQLLLGDPLGWKFTGTAMLGILLLFMTGIILMSQGILSLYISHIHNQSKGRPLYVIDYKKSVGIDKETLHQ